ncbi:unnamed protein product [Paramecium primaurelia]|uniref:Uncharacterized protein n=1 Tax=Paramecium primaurelia TaxID=5886 RepID=A0A8S1KZY3_PARPR|nr:unnamed protein product [Paramecium primaurelia]
MRKQFSFKPLSTHNDNQNLQTKSDSIGRFRSIIPIRKIQATCQFLKMKQDLSLEFPQIPIQFKNQISKRKIFTTKPQFNTHFPIKEDLSQFSKKIQQTIKTSFKKCLYQNKSNKVIYSNELSTVLYFNVTVTYEEQETSYQFIRRLGNIEKTQQDSSKQFKAKNLLKIVGVFEKYDTRQIFTFKIRSFYKMYLQNQIEWNYQHFYDLYPNSQFVDNICDKKNKLISRLTFQFDQKNELFKLHQQFCGILSLEIINNQQLNFIIENDYEDDQNQTCIKLIQCNKKIKLFKSHLQCIVNRLDNETQNNLLTEQEDHSFTLSYQNPQHFIRHLQFKVPDQNCIAFRFYNNYYEILNGIFEDTHEILNLQDNITMLEFEEPQENHKTTKMIQSVQQQQIQPKKLNFESIMKKSKHQPSITQEISPRSDHSQISSMRTPREGQLLPVLMKPQLENNKIKLRTSPPSYDDNISNSNNNQQYSTHHSKTVSQTDMVSINTPRSQRTSLAINLSLRTSMTKNSLKTRTLVVEQFKKSQQKANQLAGLLIQENKYNELVELFNNNPNLRIDERISNGNTYLMLAAQGGNLDICELILSKGASVNLQNLQGDTALHKAFQYGNFSVADLLVSYGAQVMVNYKGKTPWQL